MNQQVAGRVRTWVRVLSEKNGVDTHNTHRLSPWILRHVAWSMARLHVNSSKTTLFRIIKGHDFFLGKLLPIGECMQRKWPNTKDFAKVVPRWVRGVFVGKSENSDEFIVLTPAGAHTFCTVRRLPGDQRHNVECLECTAGWPWNTRDGSSKVQPALVVSRPRVFVPLVPPAVAAQQSDTNTDAREDHTLESNASEEHAPDQNAIKKQRLGSEHLPDVIMSLRQPRGQGPETFDIATPRSSPPFTTPDSPTLYSLAVRNRSPPRELPGEAGDTAPGQVPGAGGTEVETSVNLLTKFVEGGDEYVMSNVFEFLETCLSLEESHMAKMQEIRKMEEVFKAFTPTDGFALPPNIRVFKDVWVEKK